MGRLGMMVSHALGCVWEKCRMLGPRSVTRPTSESVGDGLISSGPAEGLVGSKRADVPSVQGPLLLKGAASIGVGPAWCREKDERRKQQPKSQSLMADCALVEEASRGGVLQPFWGDEGEPLGMKHAELGNCRGVHNEWQGLLGFG
ncbi:hypothetical protein CK203_012125 [Vitis vinifera]|uniref:Uncharacterized protein n=1 Tax=Vitis vinifera TaxID=29760 RepID=A0A438K0T8_VITVI|nr:hypothetical protein CK203_012125 [Vitis vinifera]